MEPEQIYQFRAIAYNAMRYGDDTHAIRAEMLLKEIEEFSSISLTNQAERSVKRMQFTAWTIMRDHEPRVRTPSHETNFCCFIEGGRSRFIGRKDLKSFLDDEL